MNTSLAAIQLARLSGFSPIITTASPHNASLCQSLGATHVIDRSSKTVVSDIKAVLGNKEAKVVYDAVSEKETQGAALEVVAPGGVLVLVDVMNPEVDAAKDSSKHVHIFNVIGNVHTDGLRKLGVSLYAKLTELLAENAIVVSGLECRY